MIGEQGLLYLCLLMHRLAKVGYLFWASLEYLARRAEPN